MTGNSSKPTSPLKRLSENELLEIKKEQIKLLQQKIALEQGLPHLYGWNWYSWAWDFFQSQHKENFLCAANQISKSSTMIRKFIHWATAPDHWPGLWPSLQKGQTPNQFWYFYPTQEVATIEFETKWEPLFLPKNKYKTHPVFGWVDEWDKGMIRNIRFNSGVTIYFKAYSQKAKDLQTGTVYAIGCDEELPVDLLPELQARLNATDGYFHMVFTATLGQLHWEQTMEPKSNLDEKHKNALKLQVSLFDCLEYKDGSPTHWTKEKIQRAIEKCPSEAEVQRRIYGKFVRSEGLQYQSFSVSKNVSDPQSLPSTWNYYVGVDVGSGGTAHPAAIVFVSVSPDYKRGRVVKAWRGDGVQTTAEDIWIKYCEMKGKLHILSERYDWASADFGTITTRKGGNFVKADKGRETGVGLVNTLFRTEMLKIHRGDPETEKLIGELCSLPMGADKRKAKDDLCDALRYAVASIPWDFSDFETSSESEALKEKPPEKEKTGPEQRREWFMSEEKQTDDIAAELDFWNEQSGA